MTHQFVNETDRNVYWLASGLETPAYGVLAPGQQVTSGQPNLETFTSMLAFRAALTRLGLDPNITRSLEPAD